MEEWITVAYNVGPVEIAVLKDRFEEEGILYFIWGENSTYRFNIEGGIKIQVRQKDEHRAIEILKETGYIE